MSAPYNQERGFAHYLLLIAIFSVILLVGSSKIPVSRDYTDGKSNVQGVSLAMGEGNSTNQDDISISTASGKAIVSRKGTNVSTFLPIQYEKSSHKLLVKTQSGTGDIAIFPDDAINSLLKSGFINKVDSETIKGESNDVSVQSDLEEKNGILVYKINATKNHKLLGIFPIDTPLTTYVSAQNGQVVSTDQSLLGRILNKIAP